MSYPFKRNRKNYRIFKWVHFNAYIRKKTTGLLRHESKIRLEHPTHPLMAFARGGFDSSCAVIINDRRRQFLVVSARVFDVIICDVLPKATELYPERFGTGTAEDVVRALYDVEPEGSFDWYKDYFLRQEKVAYIVEIRNGRIVDKLLRVDLFRIIEPDNATNGLDFTGGVFHAFKHFSYNGVPLSTHDESFPIEHPSFIIRLLIDGFFFHTQKPTKKNGKDKLSSEVKLSDQRILKFIFYFEKENGFYFIDSVSKQKTKKS